eukprot:NODE_198_length_1918_cov_94.585706_g174_i0.p1 GENE.NODE_198_length_1918_cov_94.585706_g174_i0~~NODE_198_length_1918_cov_94.585706_g174_i0.p1  ORF type:complete len:506 (+),score=57.46 NODE_198_length_1918_cov_94.585706_g174_i0:398-1915(+)
MTSLRGIWILSNRRNLLFSRRFPSVDKILRESFGDQVSALVHDEEWLSMYLESRSAASNFLLVEQYVCLRVGPYWPVVTIPKGDLEFIGLVGHPPVDSAATSNSLIETIQITGAVHFLIDLAEFCCNQLSLHTLSGTALMHKVGELNVYISLAVPFGRPTEDSLKVGKWMAQANVPKTEKPTQRQPGWKPILSRGKSAITLTFAEEIRAVQYDMETIPDVWEATGTMVCKAELEGVPDVSMQLTLGKDNENLSPMIRNPVFHYCAQSEDFLTSGKIIFSPPNETFCLCKYLVHDFPKLPLRGFYQMKEFGPDAVKVLVQLKLSEGIRNNFEFCELIMPFSNRGPISKIDVSPTSGSVSLSQDRKTLIWNIGSKFTGRNREVAFPGTIYFLPKSTDSVFTSSSNSTSSSNPQQTATSETMNTFNSPVSVFKQGLNSDPFCVGTTAFVKINFKIMEETITGLRPNLDSFVTYPVSRPKVQVNRYIKGTDYVIWNSLGDSRHALPPIK